MVQKVPDLSVVIDLTYTTRYYDAREVCIARAIKIYLVRMLTICVHYSKVCYNNNINNSNNKPFFLIKLIKYLLDVTVSFCGTVTDLKR